MKGTLIRSLFPYRLREFQGEFLSFVQRGIGEGKPVLVDAATGFGKTALILAAALPEALNRGLRVVWAVRTGSETDRPVEELKVICKRKGVKLFGLSFRGKRDMCLLLRDLNLSGRVGHEEASLVCEAYRGKCAYRLNLEGLDWEELELFAREPRLYAETLNFCVERKVCPYRVQLLLLDRARLLALSYNYVIDPRISRFMRAKVGFRNSVLVVDEAHNLQQAAGEANSDRITGGTVERAMKEAEAMGDRDLAGFLDAMAGYFQKFLEGMGGEEALFPLEECAWKCAGGVAEFKELCGEARRLGNKLRRKRLLEGKAPRSSLHHLGDFWLKAVENFGVDGVALTAAKEGGALAVELSDMRSGELLGGLWGEFKACVFCSGTLKPFEAYAEVVGLNDYEAKGFPSPYPKRNVASFITKGLSTRGEELSDEMAELYVEALNAFIASLNVNLAVFASSYRVQRRLLELGLRRLAEARGREVFIEEQNMRGEEGRALMEKFKACAGGARKGALV
ncbi:TPA: hypothetical protein EYP26_03080, partial [Candidatus Bathyarchaeota archaeon]|nr:hypothetical protein [Candidatus Bathyarchaeota archaeon]